MGLVFSWMLMGVPLVLAIVDMKRSGSWPRQL